MNEQIDFMVYALYGLSEEEIRLWRIVKLLNYGREYCI